MNWSKPRSVPAGCRGRRIKTRRGGERIHAEGGDKYKQAAARTLQRAGASTVLPVMCRLPLSLMASLLSMYRLKSGPTYEEGNSIVLVRSWHPSAPSPEPWYGMRFAAKAAVLAGTSMCPADAAGPAPTCDGIGRVGAALQEQNSK